MSLYRILRILILLILLATVAFYSKAQKIKSRSWAEPLEIVIYPINGDKNPVVDQYINSLDDQIFAEIDQFIERESQGYSIIASQPTRTYLGNEIVAPPPPQPSTDAHFLRILWWGLKLRFWAMINTPDSESNLHRIRIFLHYHEAVENHKLQHSLGLDKGLLAIVHGFATQQQEQQNNIVIAHELLHTVGATDKYNVDSEPVFPDGFAEPDKIPVYPQYQAEIMAGRIPIDADTSKMANNLEECIIGTTTAREINWLE